MILTYYCIITMIIIAYLLGSIPSAVWIGKKYYGIDIREHGSKNAGTTNMLRVLGRRAALPVFLLDFLKGFVAVTLTEILKYDAYINDMWLINIKIIAVFAAVLGHIFPIFAGFRGGKGVAVTCAWLMLYLPVTGVLCCLAGGVAANGRLRQLVNDGAQKLGAKVYLPELKFCGDNGAMIAAQGYYQYIAGHTAGLELNGLPTLPIDYE